MHDLMHFLTVPLEDAKADQEALMKGLRLVSAYSSPKNVKIWIICNYCAFSRGILILQVVDEMDLKALINYAIERLEAYYETDTDNPNKPKKVSRKAIIKHTW